MPNKRRGDDADGRDRRSSTRYRTRALTDGSLVDDAPKGGRAFLGTTVNVSSGGVLVRTYESLIAGQEVALTMHLPEGDLKVIGTVLHVEQDAVGCRLAGVRFAKLGEDQNNLLARHLQTFDPRGSAGALATGGGGKSHKSLSDRLAQDIADENAAIISSAKRHTAGAPSPKSAAKANDESRNQGREKAEDPAAPAKSLGDLRRRETVVWPFEGQIHRG